MLTNEQILEQFKKHRKIDESDLGPQHSSARESHSFVAGDAMFYEATVNDKGQRKAVVFNKVKPFVDTVVGTMIQIRRKPDYQARLEDNEQQQQFSSNTNSFSDYARDNANMSFLETLQDREMVITGYGAIDTNIGYEKNPDGEVVAEVLRFDNVFWDSEAKEPNLIDARWVRRVKAFSKEEVKKRFKNADKIDFESYGEGNTAKQYYPDGGEYTAIQTSSRRNDMLQVHYYQWWELQTYYRANNPALDIQDQAMRDEFVRLMVSMTDNRYNMSSEEEQEDMFKFKPDAEYLSMTPEQKGDMDTLCAEYGLKLDAVEQKRRCYYTSLITGEEVLDKFKSLDQNGFTIKFKTANYDPVQKMWYGLVRALKAPQEYMNKALTEILFTIASNSKGGVMYEESATTNPRKFEQQYASTKAAVMVADGAISGGKIMPKAQAALPTGYEGIYTMADSAMADTSGISKEFMGTANNKQVAALLESQRINQVLATLASYFDAITLYQVEHARLMLTYLRVLAQNSAGRLVRIIGENGAAEYKRLNENMLADEYDVVIGEAPVTPAQKENTTKIMIELADKLAVMGQNIYPVVVNYLPIPAKDKQALLKALTPDEQTAEAQAQAAAAKQQAEAAMNKAIIDGTNAKAQRDMAEAQAKAASIDKVIADVDMVRANTAKTLEETGSIAAQTEALVNAPVNDVRVVL